MPRDREGSAPREPDAHDYWLAPLCRQFNQRQMERQEEAGDGRQHHGRSGPDGRLRAGWSGLYRLRCNLQ